MSTVTKAIARALAGRLEEIAKRPAEDKKLDAEPPSDDERSAAREAIGAMVKAARSAAEDVAPAVRSAASKAAKRTVRHSQVEFDRLKIAVPKEPETQKLIVSAVKDVAGRFQGIVDDQVDKLARVLRDGYAMRHETLAKEIERQLGDVSQSRAEFIARDAVLTINSKITTARSIAAGIEEFIWTTSGDERVRDSHAEIDGQKFSYDDPPEVDGEPALPGEPPLCRCTAFPVLPELDEAAA